MCVNGMRTLLKETVKHAKGFQFMHIFNPAFLFLETDSEDITIDKHKNVYFIKCMGPYLEV